MRQYVICEANVIGHSELDAAIRIASENVRTRVGNRSEFGIYQLIKVVRVKQPEIEVIDNMTQSLNARQLVFEFPDGTRVEKIDHNNAIVVAHKDKPLGDVGVLLDAILPGRKWVYQDLGVEANDRRELIFRAVS